MLAPFAVHGIAALATKSAEVGRLPKSLHNCHFPGLFSIVIGEPSPGCLLRAYVAPPGGLHPWLIDMSSPFLWHAHAYSFISTTVVGHVTNVVASDRFGLIGSRPFRMYEHVLGGTSSGRTVSCTGKDRVFWPATVQRCWPGDSYSMPPDEIHRVKFLPCERTGWLVVVIRETARADRPASAWSTAQVSSLPGAVSLYRPMSTDDVRGLCDDMVTANG